MHFSKKDFLPGQIQKWLYSPEILKQGKNTETEDNHGPSHGSCVASKALGYVNGVSKRITLVVVKLAYPTLNSDLPWTFDRVLTDIKSLPQDQRAVVVFATGGRQTPRYPWPNAKDSMESRNAAIVVSAGNDALKQGNQKVDKLPAIWADVDANFPLIIAGAVDNTGNLRPSSQGPEKVTVWAPGTDVQCAEKGGFRKASGTSHSAGMVSYVPLTLKKGYHTYTQNKVAGLVAYGFSHKFFSSGGGAKTWLKTTGNWKRHGRGSFPVIWNGY